MDQQDGVKRRGVCDLDEAVNQRCRFGLVGRRTTRRAWSWSTASASSRPSDGKRWRAALPAVRVCRGPARATERAAGPRARAAATSAGPPVASTMCSRPACAVVRQQRRRLVAVDDEALAR